MGEERCGVVCVEVDWSTKAQKNAISGRNCAVRAYLIASHFPRLSVEIGNFTNRLMSTAMVHPDVSRALTNLAYKQQIGSHVVKQEREPE